MPCTFQLFFLAFSFFSIITFLSSIYSNKSSRSSSLVTLYKTIYTKAHSRSITLSFFFLFAFPRSGLSLFPPSNTWQANIFVTTEFSHFFFFFHRDFLQIQPAIKISSVRQNICLFLFFPPIFFFLLLAIFHVEYIDNIGLADERVINTKAMGQYRVVYTRDESHRDFSSLP